MPAIETTKAKICHNMEVAAKITDSMVQDYGCRVKYNKKTGEVDLVGDDYCKDVVVEVVNDMRED